MNQFSVGELTKRIKLLLEQEFSGLMSVRGEVSELTKASSGHIYFSLKDKEAKIRCVFFRQYHSKFSFIPKNGDLVDILSELRIYPPDGSYQLMVRKVEYSAEGDFWKKFEETKQRLSSEGFFDESRKKSLPLYPVRIALLTSESGAAIKDFLVTSMQKGFYFHVDIWPIPVQGLTNASDIAKALRKAGKRSDLYDVLVLTRGGGSLDDLSVFNDENIARALADSLVPTISAIGHEQDVTICDLVADIRVATPTAAAVKLTSGYVEAEKKVENYYSRLLSLLRWRWESVNLYLDKAVGKLMNYDPLKRLSNYKIAHRFAVNNLITTMDTLIKKRYIKLDSQCVRLFSVNPGLFVKEKKAKIESIEMVLSNLFSEILSDKKHETELLTQRLLLNNPERFLDKGYAMVVRRDKTLVTSVLDVVLEEELEIKMKDGYINTFVTGKKKYKNNISEDV